MSNYTGRPWMTPRRRKPAPLAGLFQFDSQNTDLFRDYASQFFVSNPPALLRSIAFPGKGYGTQQTGFALRMNTRIPSLKGLQTIVDDRQSEARASWYRARDDYDRAFNAIFGGVPVTQLAQLVTTSQNIHPPLFVDWADAFLKFAQASDEALDSTDVGILPAAERGLVNTAKAAASGVVTLVQLVKWGAIALIALTAYNAVSKR